MVELRELHEPPQAGNIEIKRLLGNDIEKITRYSLFLFLFRLGLIVCTNLQLLLDILFWSKNTRMTTSMGENRTDWRPSFSKKVHFTTVILENKTSVLGKNDFKSANFNLFKEPAVDSILLYFGYSVLLIFLSFIRESFYIQPMPIYKECIRVCYHIPLASFLYLLSRFLEPRVSPAFSWGKNYRLIAFLFFIFTLKISTLGLMAFLRLVMCIVLIIVKLIRKLILTIVSDD